MRPYFHKRERGFTLIELLVVIAIIGILATIVLISLNTARQKARDTRRISDLRQVALALEMYYDDNGAYPGDAEAATCDDWAAMETALEGGGYITEVPADPDYAYNTDLTEYVLKATLERENPALDTDVDGTPLGCDCTDSPDPNYCLQP